MDADQSFLNTRPGRVAAAVVVLAGLAAVVFAASRFFGASSAARLSAQRTFICAETKKTFAYTLQAGDMVPVYSPHSGKNTGYPAEACNWTSDGKVSDDVTYVLLNSAIGSNEPTFCPDCGRLVVGHNPLGEAGRRPPPTRQEYRGSGRRNP